VALTRAAVFAGAQEPKARYEAQVGHCKADLVAMEGGHLADIVENGERKWLDARRWRVLLGVTAKLAVQPKVCRSGAYLVMRVQGPHAGEALTDGAEVVLHCSRSDQLVAGQTGKGTNADAMSKDLEDYDLVGGVKEQGVLVSWSWWREKQNSVQTFQFLREAALRLGTTPDSTASSAKRRSRRNSSLIAGDKAPKIRAVDTFG
jgi:hypothetical protein